MQSQEKTRNQRRIKLVIGTNDLSIGGVQRLVVDQLQGLDRNSFDIYLITLMQFEEKKNFYDLIPDDIQVFKLNFKRLFDIREIYCLYRILRKIQPDVVKAALFFSNTIFSILQLFFRYKLITGEHNTVVEKAKWQIFLDKLFISRVSKIVTDSNMVSDFLITTENTPKEKLQVIYNGVDLEEVAKVKLECASQKDNIKDILDIDNSKRIFITAGRLAHQKNHQLMINAFAELCKKRNDCHLIIIGGGALMNDLEQQIRDLNVANDISLLGERKDVFKLLSISDFFVITSRHEGFCVAAMEGLAFGLPLISTKVAGIVEYLCDGKNGFFAEMNASDIANKMGKVLDFADSDLAHMKKEARDTAENFSTKRFIEAHYKLFEEVLGVTN